MNLPNQLTVARLVMVPLFVLFMSFDHYGSYIVAYLLFTVASITDYYDGKIARQRNLVTSFGKLLDPVADKVLMASAFIMMMKVPGLWVPAWAIVAIMAREFLVTGARSIAAADGAVIAASSSGKTKTVIQMVYVFVFLFFAIVERIVGQWAPEYSESYSAILRPASLIGIAFVALFTVYSGISFARDNWQSLKLNDTA